MKYPQYVFLTYGTYETQWWTINDEALTDYELKCSPEERAETLEFSLAALHFSSVSNNMSFTIGESDSRAVRFLFGFTSDKFNHFSLGT